MLLWIAFASFPAIPVNDITFTIDDIVSPVASARGVSARWAPGGSAAIVIAELKLFDRLFRKVSIVCAALELPAGQVRCSRGKLKAGEISSNVQFTYSTANKRLELTLTPAAAERWRIAADLGASGWEARVDVSGGELTRFASFFPPGQPLPSEGRLDGVVKIAVTGGELATADGNLRWSDVAFSDQAGLHAADKLGGTLILSANRVSDVLRWQAELAWEGGEVFWSPLYVPSGGHRLEANGTFANALVHVDQGLLTLADVGQSRFSLDWGLQSGLSTLSADASGLAASGLYTLLLKPMLDKTALGQLFVGAGTVDADLLYANNAIQQFNLTLGELDLVDTKGRFAIDKLAATIPWHREKETSGNIRVAAAKLASVPIGSFAAAVKIDGFGFAIGKVAIPVLDGKFLLNDLRAARDKEDWRWQFGGVLLPVSMQAVTKALDAPLMGGALSATIPKVAYAHGRVAIEGGIGIRVFDGDVSITDMSLTDPFGLAPRLNAEVEMRKLDLKLLTNTFKFGSMEGRIDADIKALELSNWKPVQFDARIESSPGDYRKKISQQAVENISALGGAGAAAAIQRSFLRFFEDFGYQKMGLSCRLRNSVCQMSGIESAPEGYIIVKGGGIPAITVRGYNREVNWTELLDRLSRITQGNVQPIIK